MRSASLSTLTTFSRGQSARAPTRPARKPRRRRMFSDRRPRAVRLQGRASDARGPLARWPGRRAIGERSAAVKPRRRAREKNLRAEIAGNPLMTLDSGRKRKGKEAFGRRFATLTRVPEASLTLACAIFEIAAPRDSPRGPQEGRNKIARTGIPEMAPQRLEKIESAPGNGAPPGPSLASRRTPSWESPGMEDHPEIGNPETRKWRRKRLKSLNSRPKMAPPLAGCRIHTSRIRDALRGTARGGGFPLLREAGKVAEGRMGCGKQVWSDEGSL